MSPQHTPMREHDVILLAIGVARMAHDGQARKYTGEPYITHCEAVARRVAEQTQDPEVIAAAWLHDTLEDTATTDGMLRRWFGERVTRIVVDVTDVFTAQAYPHLNRAERKRRETERLATISPEAKLIKLADIADNAGSIVQHDPGFAKVYLREVAAMLEVLT